MLERNVDSKTKQNEIYIFEWQKRAVTFLHPSSSHLASSPSKTRPALYRGGCFEPVPEGDLHATLGRGGEKVASNGSDKKFSRSPEIKLSTLSLPSLRGVELDFPLSADRQLISTSTPTTSMLARLSFCVGSTRSLYATRS